MSYLFHNTCVDAYRLARPNFHQKGPHPVVNEDLNPRLPPARFHQSREIPLPETLSFLANQQTRLAHA